MTWLKVDDQLHHHPKIETAGLAAVGLWVRCGSYAAAYLTEGHIPASIARALGRPRDIAALLDVGLWVPNGMGGFTMHDFLDYNPTAEQVRRERARARARQAKRRAAQARLWDEDGDDVTP
jgi:hypothetical protein